MVRDNTDMQKLPPPPVNDSEPTELVVSDKTVTDKSRIDVSPGLKPTVNVDKEHIHKPSLPLPIHDVPSSSTSNQLPVQDVPSTNKPDPVFNQRPKRNTGQPDR